MTVLWRPMLEQYPLICNSGGPASRTRHETIASSVLGQDDRVIRCPRVIRLGLEFEGRPAVAAIEGLLAAQSYASAEDLRAICAIPKTRLICRADAGLAPLKVAAASPELVLETALMLGLCTQVLYDPARPVLWTEASLSRRLELFAPEGFYA
jgi:hypothetical protein